MNNCKMLIKGIEIYNHVAHWNILMVNKGDLQKKRKEEEFATSD